MLLFDWRSRSVFATMFTVALLLIGQWSYAGPIRERIMAQRLAQQPGDFDDAALAGPVALPAGVRLVRDVPYGKDQRQRMDVYLPQQAAEGAPVIFMVHGGAWRLGDKGAQAVVENKVARWVAKGFIFISVNYRLLPTTAPLDQAQDIASALATAQAKAASWGANPAKLILMGHSAGAHLVALLAASPAMALNLGAQAWLGTVLLDSAALDVVQLMKARHASLYDRAFGSDPDYWQAASPWHALSVNATPLLAVCSSRRSNSCLQAKRFVAQASSLKVQASVLAQNLSHKQINQQLGLDGSYTDAVEAFMGGLDASVKRALIKYSGQAHLLQ